MRPVRKNKTPQRTAAGRLVRRPVHRSPRGGSERLQGGGGSAGSADVDRLYGLEPVYEPSRESTVVAEEFVAFGCPYCGEPLETRVDLTGGGGSYIEDCQVCCRPIEIGIELTEKGALAGVKVSRTD
jgi:hypothetical protein